MTKSKTTTQKLNTTQPAKPRNKPAPQTAAARLEVVPLSTLHNDPHNVNKHTERGHKLVEQSIRNRGIARPGFAARNSDGELVMLGGNLSSLEIPAGIGLDEAVLVFTDGKRPIIHVRQDLDAGSDEARLLALEDNVSGVASYDPDIVELAELTEIEGFDDIISEKEYRKLVASALLDTGEDDDGATPQIDRATELAKEWATARGQVWQLGNHRLMCGDATSADDVARLMQGTRADMMFTDPPYGVAYEGGHFHSGNVNIKRKRKAVEGDTTSAVYAAFLPVVLPVVDGPCYMWFAGSQGREVYNALHEAGAEVHALIIWHKINATYAAMNAQYKQRHEPCLYFKPRGSTLRWIGPADECTIWDMARDPSNTYHPTQKPVVLASRAISNHSVLTVLDVFAGSGSTVIACERAGKECRAMEIDLGYTAVTLQRYLDTTGNTPTLIGG